MGQKTGFRLLQALRSHSYSWHSLMPGTILFIHTLNTEAPLTYYYYYSDLLIVRDSQSEESPLKESRLTLKGKG